MDQKRGGGINTKPVLRIGNTPRIARLARLARLARYYYYYYSTTTTTTDRRGVSIRNPYWQYALYWRLAGGWPAVGRLAGGWAVGSRILKLMLVI